MLLLLSLTGPVPYGSAVRLYQMMTTCLEQMPQGKDRTRLCSALHQQIKPLPFMANSVVNKPLLSTLI